jgi:hypothetical protein
MGSRKKEVVPRRETAPVVEEPRLPPVVYDPEPEHGPFHPSRVGLGEIIGVLTILYACSIAAFNAGYFVGIGGRFVELFTFTDLVGINISLFQYFIIALFVYSVISSFAGAFLPGLRSWLYGLVERLSLWLHGNSHRFWLVFFTLMISFHVCEGLFVTYKTGSFTLMMLPSFIFHGVLLSYFWYGYKYELLPARQLVIAALVSLVVLSYNSGHAWLLSETRAAGGVQAIVLHDGQCLERKLLRTSGNGYLFYNPSLQSFEFRNKDSIRTMFDRKGCI